MLQVSTWLKKLELSEVIYEKYLHDFIAAGYISLLHICCLNDAMLETLKVKRGHRRKILAALAEPGTTTLIVYSFINTSLIHPTGFLPSLVTRCNPFHCLFCYNLSSSYTPTTHCRLAFFCHQVQLLSLSLITSSLITSSLLLSTHWRLAFSCHQVL